MRKIRDIEMQKRIYESVDDLRNWPACSNVKALSGRDDYRLRVGRWRVIFDVHQALRIIAIEEVRKRDEHTYD